MVEAWVLVLIIGSGGFGKAIEVSPLYYRTEKECFASLEHAQRQEAVRALRGVCIKGLRG